ncbi:MAG: transposase, partial [Candidatus Aerophobus sp.]
SYLSIPNLYVHQKEFLMDPDNKCLMSVAEFAQREGISSKTVQRGIKGGVFQVIKVKGEKSYRRNHIENRIHYSHLTKTGAQERFLTDRGLMTKKDKNEPKGQIPDLKPWEKKIADKREALVKEYRSGQKDIPRGRIMVVKRHFGKLHGIHYRTLDRWDRDYKTGGYYALVPTWNPGNHRNRLEDDKEAVKFLENTYMVPFGPSIKETWERYCREFGPKRERLFSYRTVADFINTKWTKEQQLLVRNKEEWDRKYSPYVRRNWEKVAVNDVWFGDAKQIDVCCLFREKPVFLYLTAFLDARSRKFVGWILTPVHDSWAIAQAFVYAVSKHGVPKTIYIDRGKSYKSYMIAGGKLRAGKVVSLFENIQETIIPGVFRDLGSEIFYAAPYNAREKIIEPNFKIFTQRLSHLPGYRGHSTKTRPKKLEREIKSGTLLSFKELEQEVDRIINERNARPHSTTGKTPDSFYEDFQAVTPSQNILAFLLMDVHQCRVGDSTVTIKGLVYRHDDLWRLAGETVEVRRDPKDIRTAAIIYKAKIFGFANLEAADHYRSPITLESTKTTARIRQRIKRCRKAVIEHEDVIDDPLKFAVELDQKQKLKEREIRAAGNVRSLHRRERLARDVVKGLEDQDIEEPEEQAVAAEPSIIARLLKASPPEESPKRRLRLIRDEDLTIPRCGGPNETR